MPSNKNIKLVIFLDVLVESGPIFTLSSVSIKWPDAKSNCEALGQHLAVLDSAEKQKALEVQM